ncbi:MAG: hypothetical protein J7494_01570 [Sphingobium sp.]|nr:hypothetical protein [Sphingobium sp.]
MSEVDDIVARANELIDRTSARYGGGGGASARGRARRSQDMMTRLKRMILAAAAVVIAASVAGFVLDGIGGTGVLIVLALLVACLGFAVIPTQETAVEPAKLAETDLKALPLKTEIWLDSQRAALPRPAAAIIDAIGNRLDTLAPQLARLDPKEPAAVEIRRLLSDHLPQLVTGYQSIPVPLRSQPRNGRVPDAQLVEGLSVIEQEIGQMTEQLATGDLDNLAAHNRYLELKYIEAKELGQ